MVRCRNCGTEIADKALICYRCGTATTDAKFKAAAEPPEVWHDDRGDSRRRARRARGPLADHARSAVSVATADDRLRVDDPPRLVRQRGRGHLRGGPARSALPRTGRSPRASPVRRSAGLHAPERQDGRLSRGLRVLPAVGPLSHRRRRAPISSASTSSTAAATSARAQGATRFCMGAAWRDVPDGAAVRARARDGARSSAASAWRRAARWAC